MPDSAETGLAARDPGCTGTARVTDINEFLRAFCYDEHLSFWQNKGFWNVQK